MKMDLTLVDVKLKIIWSVILLVAVCQGVLARNEEYITTNGQSLDGFQGHIKKLNHLRVRRDVPVPPAAPAKPVLAKVIANANESTTMPTVAVTQIPLLGVNGSGQLKVNPENMPKVSEPIVPEDNLTDVFIETPEKIKAEHNLTSLTYDDHSFYNSSFIGNLTYFNDYWANISKPSASVHTVLSNSHRRATTITLSFPFPFYGNNITNITVATGGFIYTGEHVHNWLAATQYIAPLMANFDTSLTNESVVKLYDDGEKFTAFWENVTLQENTTANFTFAVTLYKNGDIVFAYKTIPIEIQDINDAQHPVKVGISDAYLNDNIMYYLRRKTIYEYHRVTFKNHGIGNSTILRLVALPTCLQYYSCDSCLTHQTGFNCTWCPQLQKCSSGTDRNKQDWKLRNCDNTAISNVDACAAAIPEGANNKTTYSTDSFNATTIGTAINTLPETSPGKGNNATRGAAPLKGAEPARSAVGGAVAGVLLVSLVLLAGWAVYAFKNPHSSSGQLLIKYRPSQWSWKRGEARYTAATIHM